jgi:hypothetical protein
MIDQIVAEQAAAAPALSPFWQVMMGLLGGGALAKVVDWLLSRRHGDADTDSIVVNTANSLLSTMRQDLTEMRARLVEMDHRLSEAEDLVDAYRHRVIYLTDVVRQHNIPVEDWSAPK